MIKVLVKRSYSGDSHTLFLNSLPENDSPIRLYDGSEWYIIQTCAKKFTYEDVKQLEIDLYYELNHLPGGDIDTNELSIAQWNWEIVSMAKDQLEDKLLC